MISKKIVLLMFGTAVAAIGLVVRGARSYAQQTAAHDVPAAQSGGTVVMLCDGKTSIEVKNLKPGQMMSRTQAQAVSDGLMAKWKREHPGDRWEVAQASPAGRKGLDRDDVGRPGPCGGAFAGGPTGRHLRKLSASRLQGLESRDRQVRRRGQEHLSRRQGARQHYRNKLRHVPSRRLQHASRDLSQVPGPASASRATARYDRLVHRESIKGKALDPNDPKLRALEAYIYAERKGVPLEYGKH